jgi:hypothetical protein
MSGIEYNVYQAAQSDAMNSRTAGSGNAPINCLTGAPSLNAITVGSDRICASHE